MIDAISADKDKAHAAKELEEKLQALLSPLLVDWPSESAENGALLIQPRVVHLRIISGKTRMLVGLFAGQSSVSLELSLIDVKTGDIIANPEITKVTIAQAGEGVTDSNILDYIANISHQYLLVNM